MLPPVSENMPASAVLFSVPSGPDVTMSVAELTTEAVTVSDRSTSLTVRVSDANKSFGAEVSVSVAVAASPVTDSM